MPRPRPDLCRQVQQFRTAAGIWLPLFIHERIDDLPADHMGLHQRAHGVDHLEPVLRRKRPRAGQRRIPAHRVARHRHHLHALQRQEIAKRRGIDQRACVVAARMAGHGVGGRAVQSGQRFLSQGGAAGIERRHQPRIREMARQRAQLGLGIGATAGADDDGGFHFSISKAAAVMLSALGIVAA